MTKKKVMLIFGTRPEAIKMAPLVKEFQARSQHFETRVTVTAQHREMLDQVLEVFNIKPDYDLNIMRPDQTLTDITVAALNAIDEVLETERPDIVLVHGDTLTAFVAGLSAFYHKTPIAHVEAGLRTGKKYDPYPEEVNRQLIGILADLHFAPTEASANHLIQEGKDPESIYITGNTAIDALKLTVDKQFKDDLLEQIGDERILLVTVHRRESIGEPMRNMFRAMNRLVQDVPDLHLVYPVHKNPAVREIVNQEFRDHPRVHLIEPLDVIRFHNFAAHAHLILTDSGGVQEEAPSLGVPVLVLRDTTERPEGIEAGTLKIAGTQEETIYQEAYALLTHEELRSRMTRSSNPYGDGNTSGRVVDCIAYYFKFTKKRPTAFRSKVSSESQYKC